VSALVESVAAVEDEQRYVWARERAARDLNEATNTSVARWSFLELATMIAVGLAQAWAMKNYFETKVRLTAAPPRRALPRARAATAATPPPPSRARAAPAEPILTRQRRRRRQRARAPAAFIARLLKKMIPHRCRLRRRARASAPPAARRRRQHGG
jgi:hypothetical protein